MSAIYDHLSNCIPANSKLIIAVSGGVDSTVLLDALVKLKTTNQYSLIVAHLDHGLREESKSDANFVKELAEKYQIPFFLMVADSSPTTNIEAWGREIRYDFFQKILISENADWIITAHTADDQTETLLMKFFANRELTLISKIDSKRKLIRPFLDIAKVELETYAKSNGLDYVNDSSNFSNNFLRNRVRNLLRPSLRDVFGYDIDQTLLEQAERINQDSEYFDYLVRSFLEQEALLETTQRMELLAKFKNSPESQISFSWRVIQEILLREVGFKIGYRSCLRILDVIQLKSLACQIPGGYRFYRSKGKYFLERLESSQFKSD